MSFVRAGDFIRLEEVCLILGHKGGTIHQMNAEAAQYLEREIDIIGMSQFEYLSFVAELRRAVAFFTEQERRDNEW